MMICTEQMEEMLTELEPMQIEALTGCVTHLAPITQEQFMACYEANAALGEVNPEAVEDSEELEDGGPDKLFGDGDTFGEAMDQVAMSGEGDAFNAGVGYGGMGNRDELADKDTGGGRGSGKGLGKKKKVKVKPKIKFEAPKQEGFCEAEDIKIVVKRKASALRNCYERQLIADETLAGKVTLTWTIALDGKVKSAGVKVTTLNNAKVEKCMTRVVQRMQFTKPEGGMCTVVYPFILQPGN